MTYFSLPLIKIEDIADEFILYLSKILKKAFKELESRLEQRPELRERKFVKQKARGLESAIDELVVLFDYTVSREDIKNQYWDFLQRTYRSGARSVLTELPEWDVYFDEPDYDFLYTMKKMGEATFERYFGEVGSRLRGTIMETFARGDNWQQAQRNIAKVHNYSQDRANKIVRTEMARITSEARLNQYDKNTSVVEVELFSERDGAHCSGWSGGNGTCQNNTGRKYSKKEAHGLIPAHPRCRCCWIPITQTESDREFLENKLVIDGSVSQARIDQTVDAFLVMPNEIRKHLVNEIYHDRFNIVLAGKETFSSTWTGKDSGGFFASNHIHSNIHFMPLLDIKSHLASPYFLKEKRLSMIVLGPNPAISFEHTLFHEVSHYIDMVMIPRIRGYSGTRTASGMSLMNMYYKKYDKLIPGYQQWTNTISIPNKEELFADTFARLFRTPWLLRDRIKKHMPELWDYVQNELEIMDTHEMKW